MELKGRGALELAATLALCACDPLQGDDPAAAWTPALLQKRAAFEPAKLFPFAQELYRYDPLAGLLLEPDREETWHLPDGRVVIRTNNLGLLEEQPTAPRKEGLRVLVAGDSHLMVVNASESFPNLLERRLRESGLAGCEVLASGVGYTGPSLHRRRLEYFRELEPDAFVLAFFSGTDFLDELMLAYDVFGGPKPPFDSGHEARLERARQECSAALYQGLSQAQLFKHWPGTGSLALELVLASLAETQALCASRGIRFLVLVAPSKLDVDQDDPAGREQALALLGLSEEEAGVNARLAARLVEELAERDIPCVDVTAAMRARTKPSFRREDHHLATAGHVVIARALFEARSLFLSDD